jgi:hypothetical protein
VISNSSVDCNVTASPYITVDHGPHVCILPPLHNRYHLAKGDGVMTWVRVAVARIPPTTPVQKPSTHTVCSLVYRPRISALISNFPCTLSHTKSLTLSLLSLPRRRWVCRGVGLLERSATPVHHCNAELCTLEHTQPLGPSMCNGHFEDDPASLTRTNTTSRCCRYTSGSVGLSSRSPRLDSAVQGETAAAPSKVHLEVVPAPSRQAQSLVASWHYRQSLV